MSWEGSTVESGREAGMLFLGRGVGGYLWRGLGWATALPPAMAALRGHGHWGDSGSLLGFPH